MEDVDWRLFVSEENTRTVGREEAGSNGWERMKAIGYASSSYFQTEFSVEHCLQYRQGSDNL